MIHPLANPEVPEKLENVCKKKNECFVDSFI